MVHFRTQNRYEEATKVLLKAIRNVSRNLLHFTSLIKLFLQKNKFTEAERILTQLLRKSCLKKEEITVESCPSQYFPLLHDYADLYYKQGETFQY